MKPSERVIRLLHEYEPLPLTYDDLVDELGVKRGNIQKVVYRLERDGRVRRDGRRGVTGTLLSLPGAKS